MPILSLTNSRLIENDFSSATMTFRVSLDAVATAPVNFNYFTKDGTASSLERDYFSVARAGRIETGEDFVDITVSISGDEDIEPDQTFELVLYAAPGATLAGGAAALVATGIILDDDGGAPSGSNGPFGSATPIMGPTAEVGALPTLRVHDSAVIEGDFSSQSMQFLLTLDRPATADMNVTYYTQGGSAQTQFSTRDYFDSTRTVTIPAGQQSTYVSISVSGDNEAESNEDFQVVFTDINNAVFEGGAEALIATGTIIDDDSGAPTIAGGIGDPGEQISGPASAGPSPTVRIHSVDHLEGDSSSTSARLFITLDQPASVPVTLSYYTQDVTASERSGDYFSASRSITIPAGTESTWINISVSGDTNVETNENFDVVFHSIRNGRFEGNAPVVVAQVNIIEDDAGGSIADQGIGSPAAAIAGPSSTDATLPTLQIHDAKMIEGNSSSSTLEFLVTLDRPATSTVTVDYVTMEGTATASDDFTMQNRSFTIPAGQQSTAITVSVSGDTAIEGDEEFAVFLYDIRNANFKDDAAALVARGTILDNDGGPVSGPAGVGAPSATVNGPKQVGSTVWFDAPDIKVVEGDFSSLTHYVPILLSRPATTDIQVRWETLETGSAIAGTDFIATSRTITIPAGASSAVVGVTIRGDTIIESNETFVVEFTSLSNATFANGANSMRTTVTILEDDNATNTPNTFPTFDVLDPPEGVVRDGTAASETLTGTAGDDTISGMGGNDTINGLDGDDVINGGPGRDFADGGAGNDTITGGLDSDTLLGGTGDDVLLGNNGNPADLADLRDFIAGGAGNDSINGDAGNDELRGEAGNDTIEGGFGVDTVIGGDGNDVLTGSAFSDLIFGGNDDDFINGGFGSDRVNGGAGADRFFHIGVAGHGSDWIQDFETSEGDQLVFGGSGGIGDFQVNFANTPGAGSAAVDDAFVIYRPTGQILWALVDGSDQAEITLRIAGDEFDLLA